MLITFENIHVVNKLLSNNAYDIPKLAKELGFYFSLRKGRINWRKIDNIDIDNLIHERDFVNLEDNINNVINCNLDGEYDLKILDPNFIKLFKLAQLSTEYLVFMQDYLLKCLQSVQLQLKESLQENEKLKLENTKKDEDIKSLKKKMKDKENLSLLIQQLNLQSHAGCFHQCSICGKTFINAKFLQAHHERRHPESPDLHEPEKQLNSTVFDTLLNEVKVLKERLTVTERLLEENKENNLQTLKQMEHEYEKKLEVCRSQYEQQLTDAQNHLQQNMEQIENIRNPLENEHLQHMIDFQENQIKTLQEAMNSQAKENLEILKNKLEEQDTTWKKRVEEMVSRHQEIVEDLKENYRTETGKVSTHEVNMLDYENKILELKSMASIQEQQLNQQKIELKILRDELEKVSAAHMSLTNLSSKDASNVSEKPLLVQSIISSPSQRQETVTSEETSSESTASSEQRTVVTNQLTNQQHSKYPIDLKNYRKQERGNEFSTPTKREPDLEVYQKPIPVSSQVFNERESVDGGTEESSSSPSTETSTDESQVPDIERLKQAVASNPHILTKLKENLQSLMNQRLRELGIDPEWSGVPQVTFAQKMVTLQHQQNLTAKRYSDYFKIRKYYINQLKCKVPDAVPVKSSTRNEPANVPGPEKIESNASQIDKIMNRVKSKAQNVLHPVKDKGSQSSSLLQHDNRENNIKIQKPSNLYHEYGGKNSRNIKDRSIIKEQGFNVKSGKPSPVHGHREFSSKKNVAMNIRPVTSKQSGEKIMKEKGHTMLTSTPFNKRSAANSESSSPLSSTIPSPIPALRNVLGTGESRSVLKTSSTPSGNQAKKRVVFEDEDKSQQTSKQLTEVESWDSPNEEEKLQVQYDSSISSDEILPQRKRTSSSTSIKLKTKQSGTIAQLASDLNDQLKSRTTKPIGGVDTTFSSESSSGQLKDDIDKGKGDGKTINKSKTIQLSDWDLEDLDTSE